MGPNNSRHAHDDRGRSNSNDAHVRNDSDDRGRADRSGAAQPVPSGFGRRQFLKVAAASGAATGAVLFAVEPQAGVSATASVPSPSGRAYRGRGSEIQVSDDMRRWVTHTRLGQGSRVRSVVSTGDRVRAVVHHAGHDFVLHLDAAERYWFTT